MGVENSFFFNRGKVKGKFLPTTRIARLSKTSLSDPFLSLRDGKAYDGIFLLLLLLLK